MLWPKKYAKKNFSQAEKFFPSGPDRSIATATNQPEKTVQPLKSIFFERAPP
jgi:predicted nucleic acid binding AN1-type Zn finger protein